MAYGRHRGVAGCRTWAAGRDARVGFLRSTPTEPFTHLERSHRGQLAWAVTRDVRSSDPSTRANDKPLLRLFTAGTEIAPGDLLRGRGGLERGGVLAAKTEGGVAAPPGGSHLARRGWSAPPR